MLVLMNTLSVLSSTWKNKTKQMNWPKKLIFKICEYCAYVFQTKFKKTKEAELYFKTFWHIKKKLLD